MEKQQPGRSITMKEAARRVGIPESSARNYRDAFPEFIPTAGKRYRPEIIDVLTRIRAGYGEGLSAHEIRASLIGAGFAVNADATETQPQGAATQQQLAATTQQGAATLATLGDAFRAELDRSTDALRADMERQSGAVLSAVVKLTEENTTLRHQVAAMVARFETIERNTTAPRPWWQFWRRADD